MEPQTPIVKPQTFDKKKYIESLNSIQTIENKSASENKDKQSDSILFNENIIEKQIITADTSDTIYVDINYGRAKIISNKKSNQSLIFVFDSDTAKKMDIQLSTIDSLNSLLISEITDNGSNSVYPLSKNIDDFIITNKGIHQIKIESVNTENESWSGDFTFEVKLKW